ncbi:CLUMA_CG013567, isoform A [Clunio marinus]|uniref:Eukaryotic translation initiation factor 2 subunit 2 n=1 Tax=Clunio marinus TaxID=568069 RepID=A0A1J1IMI2_9DIPT|nr:CLUMA_CG013567, isoform A [Clunio marinus]
MTEEDAIFDPSLVKKKKKKKTTFDIDAVLAEGDSQETSSPVTVQETDPDNNAADGIDLDNDLDLENFGKKKRKKKKTGFNLDDLDAALPTATDEVVQGESEFVLDDESGAIDDTFDLGMKKKKKKKTEITELLKDNKENEELENVEDNAITWAGSDRDYTYDELLHRVFDIISEKNPDMAAGRKPKFVMRPPQVLRVGTKKTSFANFTEICKTLHRQPKHLLDFLLAELGTSGSVDGNSQLIIKGRFQPKQIENVLRRYIKEYVTCHTCRSPETILQKDTRIFFLQCESCGSRCSVASIKSGFQAVTSKRAAMRAKTA